jgi:hypothetical protein
VSVDPALRVVTARPAPSGDELPRSEGLTLQSWVAHSLAHNRPASPATFAEVPMRLRVQSVVAHEAVLDAVVRELAEQTAVLVGDSGIIEWDAYRVRVVSSLAVPDLQRRLGWLGGTYRVEGLEGVAEVRPYLVVRQGFAVDDDTWTGAWRLVRMMSSPCACGHHGDERHG